jgi:circadian clock protein KaiC
MKRELTPTGIQGLDDVLGGGLTKNRIYLIMGDPGVGKTTLGLHFLLEGIRRGEKVLYVALSETREEIEAVAASTTAMRRRSSIPRRWSSAKRRAR